MRRSFRHGVRLKHLSQSGYWPSGNPRLYYRPKGEKGIPLPDIHPRDEGFAAAYAAAQQGFRPQKTITTRTGSLGRAVEVYLASDSYLGMSATSRQLWRRHADRIKEEYGGATIATLKGQHVRADLGKFNGNAANHRLKVWRSMCRHWYDIGLIEFDPARDVRKRKVAATGGWKPWARADFAAFRLRWPVGTQERMAFELMYRTCAAIGDTTRLSPSMVKGGWLTYRRTKSGTEATSPFLITAPDWFEGTDDLQACIDVAPLTLTYLTRSGGSPRSAKGAASWFSRAATEAGLGDLSAHGIRKGRSAIFRENGATADQRMAILGHETEAEARNYSKSAELKKVVLGGEKFQLSKTKLELPR